ncbi:MAG: methionyl-tRNA formyltransferase [Thermoanaerobacterales bacterium]|nr:methionyl-tRNA formyltransferase [Thermoanaerobacterales bacterium]
MNLVFMGTPDFAVPSLEALLKKGHNVAAVVTQPDRSAGRKRILKPPPIKKFAEKYDLKLLQPERIRDERLLKTLSMIKPDLIVVVAYGQILPSNILRIPSIGCINVHASLLPKYRGAAPIQWAIIKGEKQTGVTTMWMDEGLDTGDIFLQKRVTIDQSWTSEDLSRELSYVGADLLIKTIELIHSDKIIRRPQADLGSSYAPLLKKADGLINWGNTTESIYNLIRGLYPWPAAYTLRHGRDIKILRAQKHEGVVNEYPPGSFAGVVKGLGFLVTTGDGVLLVEELQASGKKRTKALDYLAGHNINKGELFADALQR